MSVVVPPWLRKQAPDPQVIARMGLTLEGLGVNTICQEARCPNQGECFAQGHASFLLLGDACARSCPFCAVKGEEPSPPDPQEPLRVARAVKALGLSYVVLTSVSRDDLPDGGAHYFTATATAIRHLSPHTLMEFLIPDFTGQALEKAVAAAPEVLGHNLETVPRLYATLRPRADYRRSLRVLRQARRLAPGLLLKSGLMVGVGETRQEVCQVLEELREAGCALVTLGQYLAPSPRHHPVARYVPPQEFEDYRAIAAALGFRGVAAGPWVRSSYLAGEMVKALGNGFSAPQPPAREGYQSPAPHRASP